MLVLLILLPLAGGLLAAGAGRWSAAAPRRLGIAVLLAQLATAIALWLGGAGGPGRRWWAEVDAPWLPSLGVRLHLGVDGLSLPLIAVAALIGAAALAAGTSEARTRPGFFHLNVLWVVGGMVGALVALDLFVFYFFWELMLLPMFLLIGIWGAPAGRTRASLRFLIYTQAGGLAMLLAILGLHVLHARQTGVSTFDFEALLATRLAPGAARWLLLGFLAAFLVKLPAVGLHGWLPDAYVVAPTAGSVVLAGVLSQAGAYGLLRFAVPLLRGPAAAGTDLALLVGGLGVLYGAGLACAQTDLKRLVAYMSVSHAGFVLVGAFAGTEVALVGVMLQTVCHGLAAAALFLVIDMLEERTGSRDLGQAGGLWSLAPRLGGVTLFLVMAVLGLPGMGTFLGEFMVLAGAFAVSPGLAVLASLGMVAAPVYGLWLVQRLLHGPRAPDALVAPDLRPGQVALLSAFVVVLLGLGLAPQRLVAAARPALVQAAPTQAPAAVAAAGDGTAQGGER